MDTMGSLNCLKIVFIAAVCIFFSISGASTMRRVQIMEKILNESEYNTHFAPGYDLDILTNITVQIVVLSIDRVREAAMDYSLTIYLRQSWTDYRLRFDHFAGHDSNNSYNNSIVASSGLNNGTLNTTASAANDIPKRLELDHLAMKRVWVPDTYFSNERTADFHEVTVPNRLMHIFANGTVYYSLRLSMTLTCHMALGKYPFDRQKCPFYISSYGYTDDILRYSWNQHGALKVRDKVELPTFSISHWHLEDCDDNEFDVGNFSCLRLSVSLSRSYGHYIAQIYIPSILIVILSWVSFWLDIDAIPARISLGLLTVLTMTTMGVGARSDLPRVSYVKAIDLWMAVCLLFVFAALLEFAYVNVTTRVEKRRLSMREAVKMAQAAASAESGKGENQKPAVNPTVIKRQRARLVDKMARIIFPSIFITFNIFYWIFFMVK